MPSQNLRQKRPPVITQCTAQGSPAHFYNSKVAQLHAILLHFECLPSECALCQCLILGEI